MSSHHTDILRFLASTVLAVLLVFGHVYSVEYLGSFGLSFADTELNYLQVVALGTSVVLGKTPDFDIKVVLIVAILIFITALGVWHTRRSLEDAGFYVIVAILFFVACYGSAVYAAHLAREDSLELTTGKSGKPAICQLSDDTWFPNDFKDAFEELTSDGDMRKILETETTVYLSPVVDNPPEGYHGQSISISKDDIAYCRVLGQ